MLTSIALYKLWLTPSLLWLLLLLFQTRINEVTMHVSTRRYD